MAVQQAQGSLAAKFGRRISAAAAEHKDKPIEVGGFRKLPGGVDRGVALLREVGLHQQDKEDSSMPVGTWYWRATAVALSPHANERGEAVAGISFNKFGTLDDTPEVQFDGGGSVPARSFEDNLNDWINFLKLVSNGKMVCQETPETDPDGTKATAFFLACAAALSCTEEEEKTGKKKPTYIAFETRWFYPPLSPKEKAAKKDKNDRSREKVVVTWLGLATPEEVAEVTAATAAGAGVKERVNTAAVQPPPNSPPPARDAAPPVREAESQMSPDERAELVSELVETAMEDPDGHTEEGQEARERLEELAWELGWTEHQTRNDAKDWEEVGKMALSPPQPKKAAPTKHAQNGTVTVGSEWIFTKRGKDGNKIKSAEPRNVKVATVDKAAKTCTVKTEDDKYVVDFRTKEPAVVKWEWLESF